METPNEIVAEARSEITPEAKLSLGLAMLAVSNMPTSPSPVALVCLKAIGYVALHKDSVVQIKCRNLDALEEALERLDGLINEGDLGEKNQFDNQLDTVSRETLRSLGFMFKLRNGSRINVRLVE